MRTEYSSRNGVESSASACAWAIAYSGTTPDPPAMSCTGRVSPVFATGAHTKNAPSGPCTSSMSPARTSSTRYGDTSPSGSLSTASTTRVEDPDDAIEYDRVAE